MFEANIRDTDDQAPDVVTDRYKIIRNHEACAFTDVFIGEGGQYESTESLQKGRKV